MFIRDDRVIYSASDLIVAAECEYQLLRELDFKLGRGERVDPPPDEMLTRAIELGEAHEERVLHGFVDQFGIWDGGSSGVAKIARPERHSPEQLRQRQEETIAALQAGAEVVFQATFFDERFVGFADFLVRAGERVHLGADTYTVYDTKLARQARVPALLQLAAYADQLEHLGFEPGSEVALILGTGRESRHRLSDLLPVYRQRRRHLENLLDSHQQAEQPVAWGGAHRACGRCPSCTEQLEKHDDVLLVSGVRVSQRRKLNDAGIHTVADLARASDRVPGMAQATVAGLRAQARLQRGELGEQHGDVRIEIHTPAALAQLPEPNPGDIFFDFEGDPLYQDADSSWGIEYLFGLVLHGAAGAEFKYFWADDRAGEGRALDEFVEFITVRRREFPDMRIYHYANYEKAALLRLAARHGRHEDEIDAWLRAGLLFDLFPVVSNTLRSAAGSLGLKALEPLYMGDAKRAADVATGAESVVAYAQYATLIAGGKTREAEKLRTEILAYNEYDCVSTLGLRDWLLEQRTAAGVSPRAARETDVERAPETNPNHDDPTDAVTALESRLRELGSWAASATGKDDSRLARVYNLIAGSLEYHKREQKPFWWAHFERLSAPPDQWVPSAEVVVADRVSQLTGWERPTPRSNPRRTLIISGALADGSLLKADTDVGLLYDYPPACVSTSATAHRGWSERAKIISIDDRGDHVEITLHERTSKNGCEHAELPMAIVPASQVRTDTLAASIEKFATSIAEQGRTDLPQHPVLDLLYRRPPRLKTARTLPPVGTGSHAYISAIGSAVRDLDNSYLAVQGPPGTGKTFVGARVIAHLVAAGWKIGVTAQSHEVIENLLREIIAAGCPADQVGKKAPHGARTGERPWRTISSGEISGFFTEFEGMGAVLGGTAWDMVRFETGELDLLVIDEAGQFTIANMIAVGRATRRMLLLGDPRQLPQVTLGTHGDPVDESALQWLLGDHDTLPDDYGYFLADSWRMHSAVSAAVSRHSYEGRLKSKPLTDERHLSTIEPGIHTVFVEHQGNATSSAEEAAEVVRLVQHALEQTWQEAPAGSGAKPDPRAMSPDDVLVVAAYNAQVALLRYYLDRAGLAAVKVGTVDKLQGQQAPFVVVSMSASALDDVPRGMDFLLSRNRINVAVSRAQWCTVIVRSPTLTDFLPASITGLGALGAFIGLTSDNHAVDRAN